MTKEELEKEAKNKADIYFNSLEVDQSNVSDTRFSDYDVFVAYEKGALDFAEPREDRITELQEENGKLLQRIIQLEKDVTENESDCSMCDFPKLKQDLEKENAELKEALAEQKQYNAFKCEDNKKIIDNLKQENAELKENLKICEENADTYFDKLTKLQEQLVKTTQIGMTCSNCTWSQYDEDEMCYCCSNKDKWELKLRR